MSGVDKLILRSKPVKKSRQITLGEWVRNKPGSSKSSIAPSCASRLSTREDQIKAEKPLQARALPSSSISSGRLSSDTQIRKWLPYPASNSETIFALTPPISKFVRQLCRSRLQQDAPLLFLFGYSSDFIRRWLSIGSIEVPSNSRISWGSSPTNSNKTLKVGAFSLLL